MDAATIAAYDAGATPWRDHRPARFLDRVDAFRAAARRRAGTVADLGCGAGLHLPLLPRPVVALDATRVDARRSSRRGAPDALAGARATSSTSRSVEERSSGAWARASYLHVPGTSLPWALMELPPRAGAGRCAAHLTMLRGDGDGPFADDEHPGRFFARWQPDALGDQLVGAGFDVVESIVDAAEPEWIHVLVRRARTLPDVVGPRMRLLVCGLNPSLHAADAGVGFAAARQPVLARGPRRGHRRRVDRDARHALVAPRASA